MTKVQRRNKAHKAARRRAKLRAAENLLRKMNPAFKKKGLSGIRVKRLKGGGVTVMPVRAKRAAR